MKSSPKTLRRLLLNLGQSYVPTCAGFLPVALSYGLKAPKTPTNAPRLELCSSLKSTKTIPPISTLKDNMHNHAIVRTEKDGTIIVCNRCDPLRALRDMLDGQEKEWRAGMCSKHKTEMHEEPVATTTEIRSCNVRPIVTEESLLKKLNNE